LGGKTLTIYDQDVNQGHFNPATINPEMDNHMSLNYGSYFGEVTYGTAAYAYTYDRHLQTLHAGINYVNYGKFDGYDENGTPTSTLREAISLCQSVMLITFPTLIFMWRQCQTDQFGFGKLQSFGGAN